MLPPIIRLKLLQLRYVLRTYVAIEGVANVVLLLGLLFWVDLVGDRFLESSVVFRAVVLLLMIGLAGFVVWKRLLSRLLQPIRDRQLAVLLERAYPELGESLITSVDLQTVGRTKNREQEHDPLSDGYYPFFLQKTVRNAAHVLRPLDVRSLFRYRRLAVLFSLAMLFGGTVLGFCSVYTETAEIWFSRNILLSEKEWPRFSRIVLEGFDAEGRVRIAKGDPFPCIVKADATAPQVPSRVQIQWALAEGGSRGGKTITIDRFQSETVDGVEYRTFLHTIPELLDSVVLTVIAGDTRIEGRLIEVVPPPNILDYELTVHYPEYRKRPDQTLRPNGRATIPEGSSLAIRGRTNKPLRSGTVSINGGPAVAVESIEADTLLTRIDDLRTSALLEFSLEDTDGIANRMPVRLDLEIVNDQPPTVGARLDGIGAAITPIAVLPVQGEVTDDYGLVDVRFRFATARNPIPVPLGEDPDAPAVDPQRQEQQQGQQQEQSEQPQEQQPVASEPQSDQEGSEPIAALDGTITNQPLGQTFSVAERQLKPGDRLTLFVEASDAYSLPQTPSAAAAKPHLAMSETWQLEIVSPARLQGMLDAREIGLRERFEALIEDVRRTQGLLEELSWEKPTEVQNVKQDEAQAATEPENQTATEKSDQPAPEAESRSTEERPEGKTVEGPPLNETAERRPEPPPFDGISEEQAERGTYNISRAQRDAQKETYELQGIVGGFTAIRKEMVNNQIFSPDLQERIDGRILVPLKSLIEKDFFDLETVLAECSRSIENRATVPRGTIAEQHRLGLSRLAAILEKMAAIRDQMLNRESFNEAVDLLREIIQQQKDLREETIEQRKQQLRSLLE